MVMKRVEMHPAIVPVLIGIKVVSPDLDELHHTRQVYMLKQEEYVFAARGLRQALCNLMYLLLRHCVVDLPKMVLAHRNELQHPRVPAPSRVISEDLGDQCVQADAALLGFFFEA